MPALGLFAWVLFVLLFVAGRHHRLALTTRPVISDHPGW